MVIVVAIFITIIIGSGNQFLKSHKLLERDRARKNNSIKARTLPICPKHLE